MKLTQKQKNVIADEIPTFSEEKLKQGKFDAGDIFVYEPEHFSANVIAAMCAGMGLVVQPVSPTSGIAKTYGKFTMIVSGINESYKTEEDKLADRVRQLLKLSLNHSSMNESGKAAMLISLCERGDLDEWVDRYTDPDQFSPIDCRVYIGCEQEEFKKLFKSLPTHDPAIFSRLLLHECNDELLTHNYNILLDHGMASMIDDFSSGFRGKIKNIIAIESGEKRYTVIETIRGINSAEYESRFYANDDASYAHETLEDALMAAMFDRSVLPAAKILFSVNK